MAQRLSGNTKRLTVVKLPLEWFTNQLTAKAPFAFARYGDGEFQAILGHSGRTKDGQTYTAALREGLTKSLLFPGEYLHAVGPMATRMHGPELVRWLEAYSIHLKWYDTEVFLEASIEGRLKPFMEALRGRKVMYFGPHHLKRMEEFLPGLRFWECEAREAYGGVDRLFGSAVQSSETHDVMLFSCGPTSKVLIHRLHQDFPKLTLIDIGSLFDPYFGRQSRSYMSRYDWKQLTRINLK